MNRTATFIVSMFALAACSQPAIAPSDEDPRKVEARMDALIADNGAPTAKQSETFGSLTQFVGKSFKGYPSGANEPYDLQTWEWALGGTSILIRHAMEDGSYGGDTYVYEDAASGDLTYVYITNAGFRTEGVMTVNDDGSFTAVEDVLGHETITQVSSTSRLNEDGTTTMTSKYLKDGGWTDGHSFSYEPTNEALPTLKGPPPL